MIYLFLVIFLVTFLYYVYSPKPDLFSSNVCLISGDDKLCYDVQSDVSTLISGKDRVVFGTGQIPNFETQQEELNNTTPSRACPNPVSLSPVPCHQTSEEESNWGEEESSGAHQSHPHPSTVQEERSSEEKELQGSPTLLEWGEETEDISQPITLPSRKKRKKTSLPGIGRLKSDNLYSISDMSSTYKLVRKRCKLLMTNQTFGNLKSSKPDGNSTFRFIRDQSRDEVYFIETSDCQERLVYDIKGSMFLVLNNSSNRAKYKDQMRFRIIPTCIESEEEDEKFVNIVSANSRRCLTLANRGMWTTLLSKHCCANYFPVYMRRHNVGCQNDDCKLILNKVGKKECGKKEVNIFERLKARLSANSSDAVFLRRLENLLNQG